MLDWLVAHTKPQKEFTAEYHLRRQGFEVYIPQYLKRSSHARRTEIVKAPLFPRYIFVGCQGLQRPWRSINSTIGVSNLVCFGAKPVPVPREILQTLRATEDEKGLVVLGRNRSLKLGERVEILHAAFGEVSAIVEQFEAKNRVALLLELLGRQVRVVVPLESVIV